jgi:hypothetical protein
MKKFTLIALVVLVVVVFAFAALPGAPSSTAAVPSQEVALRMKQPAPEPLVGWNS